MLEKGLQGIRDLHIEFNLLLTLKIGEATWEEFRHFLENRSQEIKPCWRTDNI